VKVTPTCFGPLIRPSPGGAYALLYAVTRLSSADLRSLIVLCSMWLYVLIASLCAWPVFLPGWDLVMEWCHNQISPWQEHRSRTQTGDKHIQPHTAQNNQLTQIDRTQPSNSIKYGICAPWGLSNKWTETCRSNFHQKCFLTVFLVF